MILKRFFDENLAQTSYLVGCEHKKVAMVVDPNRDINQYIDAAARDNIAITHVTETHIHADFVSGARDLAAATGAQLLLSGAGGHDWQYAFAADAGAELLTDGSTFMIGDVKVEAVHTPGHTPEHMSFLLTDTASGTAPMGALTGDFIFVGDVGRPDLLERAAGQAGTMEASARQLFHSLQSFKSMPDYLQIWPGHGAGSACGKALGAMPQSSLGYEKLFNWGLAEQNEDSFVEAVLEGQPEPPDYFAVMKRTNRDGRPAFNLVTPRQISAADAAKALADGSIVVDTRTSADFASAHAAGTISIPRNKSFLNWAGALLPYDAPLIFIADGDEPGRRELAADLSLIGLDTIAGVLPFEHLDNFQALVKSERVDNTSMDVVIRGRDAVILDVRGRREVAAGHIPDAINIPLAELQHRTGELPDANIIVHCQGGSRSMIAASILQRDGKSGVTNMPDGFAEWERSGRPVERGTRKTGA